MIRVAGASDAAALGRVHAASWHETYAGLLPAEMLAAQTAELRATAWKHMLDDPASHDDVRVHVAERGEEIVGFGACGRQRNADLASRGFDGEIGAIYILKSSQASGLGRALMKAMAADLTGRGYRGTSLWVLRDNEQARRFYERLGGTAVAQQEDRRPDGVLVEVAYGWPDITALLL